MGFVPPTSIYPLLNRPPNPDLDIIVRKGKRMPTPNVDLLLIGKEMK